MPTKGGWAPLHALQSVVHPTCLNAKSQYKRNNTSDFIAAELGTPEAKTFLMQAARTMGA
jgi:hypothetical protein